MGKVRTVQINNRLVILDGEDPMRYVDLEKNKLHIYKERKPFKLIFQHFTTLTKRAKDE